MQGYPDGMSKRQINVNPNLIMVPITPITYTSARLHENMTDNRLEYDRKRRTLTLELDRS